MVIKVISVEATRQVEAAASERGMPYETMMQNAGRAVAARVLKLVHDRQIDQARVTVLVGPGNNGGDGLVAAREIAQHSNATVRCYLLRKRDDDLTRAAQEAGLLIANAEDDQRYRVLFNMVASSHVLVDALFGIGARLPLPADADKLLKQVHAALNAEPESDLENLVLTPAAPAPAEPDARPYIVAVDCPSGLDCETGQIDKQTIPADETMTFIAAKPGLFIFPGAAAVGTLSIAPLGIPADIAGLKESQQFVVDADLVRQRIPKREPGSHKGTFGKALVVGGSINYSGAPALSAEGAYRIGAGVVTVAAPPPVIPVVGTHLPEATYILLPHDMGVISSEAARIIRDEAQKYTSLLIGPGLGREDTTGRMLELLIDTWAEKKGARRSIGFAATVNAEANAETPDKAQLPALTIDADGLFLLSQIDQWWTLLSADTVLTPHPGEMSQLSGLPTDEIQADRWHIAAKKAAEWNVVLVLKGAHTLIAEPGGQVAVLPFKTAALATAGTGDVLAGMIAGLRAQGMSAFDAAICAGYVHGLAGELMGEQVGTRGTLASDVARYGVPQALRLLD